MSVSQDTPRPGVGSAGPSTRARSRGRRLSAPLRNATDWGINHALPHVAIRAAARRGDLQARFILASRDGGDVIAASESIRDRGRLVQGRIGWTTTDHALVREVLARAEFRSGVPIGSTPVLAALLKWSAPDRMHPLSAPSLLVTEPPDHTRYRRLVTSVFTGRAVRRLRERTETIAARLLDELAERARTGEQVDLVEGYCARLPVSVISEILGVPPSDQNLVLQMGTAVASSLDFGLDWADHQRVERGLARFDGWLTRHLDRLRRDPGENLLSELIAARDVDGALSEDELKSTAGLILAAGFETTVNLLSNGIRLLHDHPDQVAAAAADPTLWANAVEEVLRLDPPVLLTGRMTQAPTTLAGQSLPAGTHVTTILMAANRDPNVFTDPHRFDITRENAREHLSFSAGRHFCLGASLARMEGEVGLRAFYDRFADLHLLPGAHRRHTRILRGWERLPARLNGPA